MAAGNNFYFHTCFTNNSVFAFLFTQTFVISSDIVLHSQPTPDEDTGPPDSVSNADRRGSDMSATTGVNAYVLLDLPDLTRDRTHMPTSKVPATDSVRSVGDIELQRVS